MPAEVTLQEAADAAIDAALTAAGGFLPEPWRSAVLIGFNAGAALLRPDLIEVNAGADTVVTVEAE